VAGVQGPKAGDRFADRYEIVERIGEGGMGVVYAAKDTTLRRPVAIKVLSSSRVGNKTAAARLRREARAAAAFADPGIAQVFDFGETPEGGAFLVMELVHGKIIVGKPPPQPEVLRIVREVARTLDAAHAVGLIHRDVKPDNIMIRDDGRVTLLDFGIAKDVGSVSTQRGGEADSADSVVTAAGTLMGTPPYVSPEQIKGKDVGPTSDQFSLAVVAYVLLTGKKPWDSATELGILGQILMEPSIPASERKAGLSKQLDAVFERAFAKDPGGRYPDVRSFAAALEAAVLGLAEPALPGDDPPSMSIEVVLDEPFAAPAKVAPAPAAPVQVAATPQPEAPAYHPPVWKIRVDEPEPAETKKTWLIVGGAALAIVLAVAGAWLATR
jgi:serine/threonine-protein kinase